MSTECAYFLTAKYSYSYSEGEDSPNECPGYDPKQSDGDAPAMLKLWGMQCTPSLSSLPGSLWPRVVASDRVK